MRSMVVILAATAAAVAAALPPKTLQLDLVRIVNQSAYGVEMAIGTPPQKMYVEVDTGSEYLGLAGTKSNWCTTADKPCTKYGSYDNTTSRTAVYVNSQFENDLYNHGFGDYINDTVRISGQVYPDLEFGMVLDYFTSFPVPTEVAGLMGLTPHCNGKNYSCSTPVTFEQILVSKGYIARNTLGVYLGPDEPSATGQMLFGAIDCAKQLGQPVTFHTIPLSNPNTQFAPNQVNFSSMSVERISSTSPTVSTTPLEISAESYGPLDTGNPNWGLPTSAWNFAHAYFGLSGVDPYETFYPVDCKFRQAQNDQAALIVGFDADRLKIRVPMERLVTQFAPNVCGTAIQECGTTGEFCSFGDPFLRSTYLSFDFDNQTVTMSNVRYTDATNIVAA